MFHNIVFSEKTYIDWIEMKEFIVGKNEEAQRFDKLLLKYLNQASSSFIYKMLRKKNITLNGRKATGNEKLVSGDVIKIFLSDETFAKFSNVKFKLSKSDIDVLYEDDDIILVNKPVGLLSQKAKETDLSLNEMIISYLIKENRITLESLSRFKPGICNRLDRNTSGIIIAGKSLLGLQVMSLMLKDRTLEKHYLALVKGKLSNTLTIDGYLAKDNDTNKVKIIDAKEYQNMNDSDKNNYSYIMTKYTPVGASGNVTLLDIDLITGRTHQIRAHLSHIGHPLIGDYKYGDKPINDTYKKRYRIESQLLHCYKLIFPDQISQMPNLSGKTIEAPMPDKFSKIIKDEQIDYGNMEFTRA